MGAMGDMHRFLLLERPGVSVQQVHRLRISQGHTRLQPVEPSNEKYSKVISRFFFEYFKLNHHVHPSTFDSYLMAV